MGKRKFGAGPEVKHIAPNFDDPLPEFETPEYGGEEPPEEPCTVRFRAGVMCKLGSHHKGPHKAYDWFVGKQIRWDASGKRIAPGVTEDCPYPELENGEPPPPKKVSRKLVLEFLKEMETSLKNSQKLWLKYKGLAADDAVRLGCDGSLAGVKTGLHLLEQLRFKVKTLRE